MKRREVVHGLTIATASIGAPTLLAQAPMPVPTPTGRVMRLGVLGTRAPTDPAAPGAKAFVDGMKALGWEEGRNLVIEYRWGLADPQLYAIGAQDLVAARVDVIFAPSDLAVAAAWQATKVIPIVMLATAAVELGYARSLAQPGGNVTGAVWQTLDYIVKEVSMLMTIRPDMKRFGTDVQQGLTPIGETVFRAYQIAVSKHGATLVALPPFRSMDGIDATLAAAKREGVQALVLAFRSFLLGAGLERINAWAVENKVLTYAGTWARGQVLLAFGPGEQQGHAFAQLNLSQIDRILRGAKPADMPIHQPTRFDLVMNLKIARAMGLSIPRSLLLQATEVID